MISPTKLSLKLLKEEGYVAEVVEVWNPFSRTRKDLFGILDIVAIKDGVFGVLGIQTTSKVNTTARLKKASTNEKLLTWYRAGNKFEVWGWYKKDGKYIVEKRELVKEKYLPKTPKIVVSYLV